MTVINYVEELNKLAFKWKVASEAVNAAEKTMWYAETIIKKTKAERDKASMEYEKAYKAYVTPLQ